MINNGFTSLNNWQDWIVVCGYISFTVFILWQVLKPR